MTPINRACLGLHIETTTDHGAWTPKERRAREGHKRQWLGLCVLALVAAVAIWKIIL